MKTAVVGCGAVGSFYGAKLAAEGHEVHFLLRSDYDVVRIKGVSILSPQGDFHVHPRAARTPEEIGVADLVLIGLKTTANDQFARLLPPLVGPASAVVTLQNGLGNEEQLARLFPIEQILGGLCFVCLNRLQPGLIRHLDYGQVVLGEYQRPPQPRTHELATLFEQAGVPCTVADNLARTHWEKLVWNIPFNGLGVAGVAGYEAVINGRLSPTETSPGPRSAAVPAASCGGVSLARRTPGEMPGELAGGDACATRVGIAMATLTTDKLLGDLRWTQLLRELMLEVIATARALGFDLPESLAERQLERTRTMGEYKASTLIDFERGQPLELESLFLEPLRQARQAGVPVPRLEALCRVLQQLE
jgi:2-dehydropantoate 2-reductase